MRGSQQGRELVVSNGSEIDSVAVTGGNSSRALTSYQQGQDNIRNQITTMLQAAQERPGTTISVTFDPGHYSMHASTGREVEDLVTKRAGSSSNAGTSHSDTSTNSNGHSSSQGSSSPFWGLFGYRGGNSSSHTDIRTNIHDSSHSTSSSHDNRDKTHTEQSRASVKFDVRLPSLTGASVTLGPIQSGSSQRPSLPLEQVQPQYLPSTSSERKTTSSQSGSRNYNQRTEVNQDSITGMASSVIRRRESFPGTGYPLGSISEASSLPTSRRQSLALLSPEARSRTQGVRTGQRTTAQIVSSSNRQQGAYYIGNSYETSFDVNLERAIRNSLMDTESKRQS